MIFFKGFLPLRELSSRSDVMLPSVVFAHVFFKGCLLFLNNILIKERSVIGPRGRLTKGPPTLKCLFINAP
jgi:hypothetical protein